MKDKQSFEQTYRNFKRQSTPDLWDRIEPNLKEYPKEYRNSELTKTSEKLTVPADRKKDKKSCHPIYYLATTAAALFLLAVVVPRQMTIFKTNILSKTNETSPHISETLPADETMTQAVANASQPISETGANAAKAGSHTPDPSLSAAEGFPSATKTDSYATETIPAFDISKYDAEKNSGLLSAAEGGSFLSYSQLNLTDYSPLSIPEQAATVPEDTMYFSEKILDATELLCQGTVTSVWLESDPTGTSVKVAYDISLDNVYYSEDYTTNLEHLTVTSPIVKAESADNRETDSFKDQSGTAGHILYQLQPGATYLLPLKKTDTEWELLCPFAPQIRITEDGAYLFHSDYTSLINAKTSVVIGNQEGNNDFYYDKMLLRQDEEFLSEFISLVTR